MTNARARVCPKCKSGVDRGESGSIQGRKCHKCDKGMNPNRGPSFVRIYADCDWHYWLEHWPKCPERRR